MKNVIAPILLFVAVAASAADMPHFMTGSWKTTTADGSVVEEHWTAANGGLMVGMSRTVPKKDPPYFEFMRIAMHEGKLAYLAMPGGEPATAFPLKSMTATRAVFENPKNDFPTRIIYWRSDKKLCARIEGIIDGKDASEQWCWSPATLGR